MTRHVFVYGTLMSGYGMSLTNSEDVSLVGRDTIQGTMFNVNNSFPGIILGEDDTIQGELYEINDPKIMDRLDIYEGCHSDTKYALYVRRVVQTGNGIETYVYEFNRDTSDLSQVENGDWRQHTLGERT